MRLGALVEQLTEDLVALGALGDEATRDAARRLAVAMQAPLTTRVLEALGEVAAELGASLPGQRVEVRLVGGDALLVVDAEPAPEAVPPPEGDDTETRITLRLPAQLKSRVEAASTREGLSVNSYIVRALSQQAQAPRGFRVGHRLSGYGRS